MGRFGLGRAILITILTAGGLSLLAVGLLVPAFLRAVDARVLERTGQKTPTLVEEGFRLVEAGQVEPARILLAAAERAQCDGAGALRDAIRKASRPAESDPVLSILLATDPREVQAEPKPVVEILVRRQPRQEVLRFVSLAPRSGVREVLRTRELTNLVHFAPAASSSGQPFEAAVVLAALVLERADRPLRDAIESVVFSAIRRGEVQALELLYLDLTTLGRRLSWPQLTLLLKDVEGLETLRDLANLARSQQAEWPLVYAAAYLTAAPQAVVRYCLRFGSAGLTNLAWSIRLGQGAARRLVTDQKTVHHPSWRQQVAAYDPFYSVYGRLLEFTLKSPGLALGLKYACFILGAFFVASAVAWPLVPRETEPAADGSASEPVFKWFGALQLLLAGCVLVAMFALSEPLRTQSGPGFEFPFRWKFPMVEGPVRATVEKRINPMVDSLSLMSLTFFMGVQVIIYIFCRRKLAEIKRQTLPDKLKLKLLDNEENLFDAGLYFGFVGTVLSLVCVSIGVIKPSLMAAYSSTSFGIIFVSILKIFYLRPYRRKLILEIETQPA